MLYRFIANAVGILLAAYLVPGFTIMTDWDSKGVFTLVMVVAIFGLVNAVLKPILKIISFPLMLLTFGLFVLVINAAMLLVTAEIAGALSLPFWINDFGTALLAGLIIALVNIFTRRLAK